MTSDRLRACLIVLRWTGADLARALDCEHTTVRRWLTYCTTCKPVVRQAAPVPLPVDTSEHVCWGAHRRTVYDARGIYAFSCCAICEQEKRARFRREVFTDANYQCDEPVEED